MNKKRARVLLFIGVFLISMFGGKNALYAIGTLTVLYYIGQTNTPWEGRDSSSSPPKRWNSYFNSRCYK